MAQKNNVKLGEQVWSKMSKVVSEWVNGVLLYAPEDCLIYLSVELSNFTTCESVECRVTDSDVWLYDNSGIFKCDIISKCYC